jgi:tripartite-type tricarboxylate transporter receptor subunit TctC
MRRNVMPGILRNGLIAFALLWPAQAFAQEDVAAFYRGKVIQVTNAFGEGGLYSTLARLLAEHLPRHLPGRPGGIPQFMPGAGGIRQMNFLYNAAPKDGTVIGLMYDNIPITQVLQPDESLRFDARRFGVLGSLGHGEAGLVGVLKRTGVATLDDARRQPTVFGATGTSSAQYYIPQIMNRLFGTRFKLIPGYKTTTEMYLAMERGELDGIYGAPEVILESRPDWINERQFNWLAQLNDVRSPGYEDVPLLQELATAPTDQAAFRLLALARVPGRVVVAPPDLPPTRLAALRTAFTEMLADPQFIDALAHTTQPLEPRTWQDAERVIRDTIDTPPEVVARVHELLKATEP